MTVACSDFYPYALKEALHDGEPDDAATSGNEVRGAEASPSPEDYQARR